MHVVRYFLFLGFIFFFTSLTHCKKNSGGAKEENLVVETAPIADGHLETPAPGPDFPLRVTIKSAMPSGGVKIDVTGKPDGSTSVFFTASLNSSTSINAFNITGTPFGVVSVVEITVTSISTSSNRWTGSYRYSRK